MGLLSFKKRKSRLERFLDLFGWVRVAKLASKSPRRVGKFGLRFLGGLVGITVASAAVSSLRNDEDK